jgi:hypothetical protein
VQGSDEWLAARCGLLTASEMHMCVNLPKKDTRVKKNGEPYKQREMSTAQNDALRAHIYEIAAQRISQYVEPCYISSDMLRGHEDELYAVMAYEGAFGVTDACGFMVRDFGDVRIGYSPDRIVGDSGLIECKSRRQKFQVQTLATQEVPTEHVIQCQTGLLHRGF